MNERIIYRLIYTSRLNPNIKSNIIEEFRSILLKSQKYNKLKQITGFLVFDRLNFIQIIEGHRDKVWELFRIIENDDRHHDIKLIQFVDCERRQFSEWSMGGCLRTVVTDHIFLRYGFIGAIESNEVRPDNLIALSHDLMVAKRLEARM